MKVAACDAHHWAIWSTVPENADHRKLKLNAGSSINMGFLDTTSTSVFTYAFKSENPSCYSYKRENYDSQKYDPPEILDMDIFFLDSKRWGTATLTLEACCPESFAKGRTKVKTTEITQATNFQKRDTQEGNLLMEQKLVTVKRGKAESLAYGYSGALKPEGLFKRNNENASSEGQSLTDLYCRDSKKEKTFEDEVGKLPQGQQISFTTVNQQGIHPPKTQRDHEARDSSRVTRRTVDKRKRRTGQLSFTLIVAYYIDFRHPALPKFLSSLSISVNTKEIFLQNRLSNAYIHDPISLSTVNMRHYYSCGSYDRCHYRIFIITDNIRTLYSTL
ncbi:hypothetical protein MG293_011428 [Ovis ammon polii]|uniref:Uncharacterized protein n=1 Tax=Ovis ammon polii TaxID=230172 RepID=A0AAD4U6E7_OVIAM|nr:hypothetical protein MG293_011428 [Ovis ammon polii]KAI4562232.1 hypothetical protein MJT46_011194 [Ovis ammon polii x Ovis aries]